MMRVTLKIPSAPKRVLVAILARKGPVGTTNGRVDAARDPEYTPYDPSDAAAAEIQIDAHRIFMDSATGGIDDLVEKTNVRVPEETPLRAWRRRPNQCACSWRSASHWGQ